MVFIYCYYISALHALKLSIRSKSQSIFLKTIGKGGCTARPSVCNANRVGDTVVSKAIELRTEIVSVRITNLPSLTGVILMLQQVF